MSNIYVKEINHTALAATEVVPSSPLAQDIAGKQDALSAQTAYTAKGSATKVPQITTNNLGQVTGITEVDINAPFYYQELSANPTDVKRLILGKTNENIASGTSVLVSASCIIKLNINYYNDSAKGQNVILLANISYRTGNAFDISLEVLGSSNWNFGVISPALVRYSITEDNKNKNVICLVLVDGIDGTELKSFQYSYVGVMPLGSSWGWSWMHTSYDTTTTYSNIYYASRRLHKSNSSGVDYGLDLINNDLESFIAAGYNDSNKVYLDSTSTKNGIYVKNNGVGKWLIYTDRNGQVYVDTPVSNNAVEFRHVYDASVFADDSPANDSGNNPGAKSYFVNSVASGKGVMVYNRKGTEYTNIFSKAESGNYGSIVKYGYDSPNMYMLRYHNGSWKNSDWESLCPEWVQTIEYDDSASGKEAVYHTLTKYRTVNAYNETRHPIIFLYKSSSSGGIYYILTSRGTGSGAGGGTASWYFTRIGTSIAPEMLAFTASWSDSVYTYKWVSESYKIPGDIKSITLNPIVYKTSTAASQTIDIVDNRKYRIDLDSSGAEFLLDTDSDTTCSALITLTSPSSGSCCGTITLRWHDESGLLHTLEYKNDTSPTVAWPIYLQVSIRYQKFNESTGYGVARVTTLPSSYIEAPSNNNERTTDNAFIGHA